MSDALGKMASALDEFLKDNRVQGDIEFPIEVSSVKALGNIRHRDGEVGAWCSIRLVEDKKTYLGIYLGDLTLNFFHSYNVKTKVLSVIPNGNPAIFVPDLKRVAWGCESWWGFIKSPDDLRKITDADIENIWYVKALKELAQ